MTKIIKKKKKTTQNPVNSSILNQTKCSVEPKASFQIILCESSQEISY